MNAHSVEVVHTLKEENSLAVLFTNYVVYFIGAWLSTQSFTNF